MDGALLAHMRPSKKAQAPRIMADNLLGKNTTYPEHFAPEVLFPIPRSKSREALGMAHPPPFSGSDLWNAYEISWLQPNGLPQVAVGELVFDAHSPNLVESKSLKLFLNSLNNERYESLHAVEDLLEKTLGEVSGKPVSVSLRTLDDPELTTAATLPGRCIDGQDLSISSYLIDASLLRLKRHSAPMVEETLHSHLLRTNCPVTNQPDWASVLIRYAGAPIDEAALLRYLVSFRNHSDYHEQCVERIYHDLLTQCQPQRLTVQALYTRRGGLDINPFRSNDVQEPIRTRLWRQ